MSKNKPVRVIDKYFLLFIIVPLLIAGVSVYLSVSASAVKIGTSAVKVDTSTVKIDAYKSQEKAPFVFFPLQASESIDTTYYVDTYADITDPGGASTIAKPVKTDSVISTSFTLRSGVEYPYAGVYISPYSPDNNPEGRYFDLSGYTDVEIVLKSETGESFFMYIKTLMEERASTEAVRHAQFRADILIENGVARKKIKLANFIIPSWWKDVNAPELDSIKMDLSRVQQIDFTNGNINKKDQLIDVTIDSIVFTMDNSELLAGIKAENDAIEKTKAEIKDLKLERLMAIVYSLIGLILYFVLIYLWKSGKLRAMLPVQEDDDSEKIIISYDKVEMKDEQEDELERITEQIAKNYSSPTFSVEQLAKEAGVSTTKIPALLKHKYSMNFKQYLNMVRVTEAKRLLLETDHQIVTIAHSVGYNNIPHFNRTFKQHTGLSPKKYRKEPETAENNIPGSQSKES